MSADIDIDMPDRSKLLELIQHVPARQTVDGKPRRHNSGIYVTEIPRDVINDCSAIDYEEAEKRFDFEEKLYLDRLARMEKKLQESLPLN